MSDSHASISRPLDAVILAAGQGTRMKSDRAKVLHEVAGRAMIDWVVDACEQVGCRRVILVVGHQADRVRDRLSGRQSCQFVEQREQLGTGHAVMQARPFFTAENGDREADVLVLCGDGPLIRPQTLRTLRDTHREAGAAATLATAVLDDPTGYGRIIRDRQQRFVRIVEHKDADEPQRQVREVNPSYYCFDAVELFHGLDRIDSNNAKGEYYLTDVLGVLVEEGKPVEVVAAVPPEDVLSINTPQQLLHVDQILQDRQRHADAVTSEPDR